MLYLIFGILFFLFTLWDLRNGKADLLSWLGHFGLDVTRDANGIFFWLAIVLQLLVALGAIAWGAFVVTH